MIRRFGGDRKTDNIWVPNYVPFFSLMWLSEDETKLKMMQEVSENFEVSLKVLKSEMLTLAFVFFLFCDQACTVNLYVL